jgi:hypothetical protein
MTVGTFLLVLVAVCAWFVARAIDNTDRAKNSRVVQLFAFMVGMCGAATPMILVVVELVERTTVNEAVAVTAFIGLCLRRDRLIWRRREEEKTDDIGVS